MDISQIKILYVNHVILDARLVNLQVLDVYLVLTKIKPFITFHVEKIVHKAISWMIKNAIDVLNNVKIAIN